MSQDQYSEAIFHSLNSDNYQVYNRDVARKLGSINAAVLLSELINRHIYHKGKNELMNIPKQEGLWFFYTVDKCTERTTLSEKQQANALEILRPFNLFERSLVGSPPKRFFKPNIQAIADFMVNLNINSKTAEREELVPPHQENNIQKKFISAQTAELIPPKRRNSPIYKNPIEELQRTTTPTPSKPIQEKKEVVVVFSEKKKEALEKVSLSQKEKEEVLSKFNNLEDSVFHDSIEAYLQYAQSKVIASPIATLTQALKDGWKRKKEPEEIIKEMEKVSDENSMISYRLFQIKERLGISMQSLTNAISIQLEGIAKYLVIKYEDSKFREKLDEYLLSKGFSLKALGI